MLCVHFFIIFFVNLCKKNDPGIEKTSHLSHRG